MKKKLLLFIMSAFLVLSSCKKEEDTPINPTFSYPEMGLYGNNILDLNRIIYTEEGNSLFAELGDNAQLKIKITGLGNGVWFYALNSVHNWSISSYDYNLKTQTFTSIENDSKCELDMIFNPGKYLIEYYEGGSSEVTKSKEIEI